MKIQCDVCSKNEASVFCTADEAALCDVCDQRVHHANKLASKHQRFSLLYPSLSNAPICDICQEKRALFFCQQDRAILCRDCEVPLHRANEHTQKHNRFLLTGIKLSAATISDTSKNIGVVNGVDPVPDFKSTQKPTSLSSEIPSSTTSVVTNNSSKMTVNSVDNQLISGGSTCNISDYVTDMLPGWHFDDFPFDPASTPAPYGFCKSVNNIGFEVKEDMLSFFDVENEKNFTSYSTQYENFWVPQAPAAATTTNVFDQPSVIFQTSTKQQETSDNGTKMISRKGRRDDNYTVPQITSSAASKRGRFLW